MKSSHPVVEVENVSKKYCRNLHRSLRYGIRDLFSELTARDSRHRQKLRPGEFWAVNQANFEIRPGECVALLGPNGAGKSTMLKMIAGLFKPDVGKITVRGRLGALIELGTGFNTILSGRENVYVNGAILGMSRRQVDEKFDEIVDFADVGHVIDDPVRTYSSGMKVRLGFAVATHLSPQVLLLDEVLAVGDVGFRMKCFAHILKQVETGMSLIIVSHAIGQLNRVSSRAIVMHKHQVVYDGEFSDGAALYERLLIEDPKNKKKEEANDSDCYIDSITILPSRNGNHQFATGDDITAQIRIVSKNPVPNARMRIAIESARTGVLGGFATPLQSFDFDLNPPHTTIAVTLPNVSLLMGAYTISAAIYGENLEDFIDRKKPGATFEITEPRTASFGMGEDGVVRFEHRWKLVD